jgi:Ca2+-binding RTX toxin-like protein
MSEPPFVAHPIPDQISLRHGFWQFQFAADAFADVDGSAALTYTAALGNGAPLPHWLTFDGATRTFSGTPPRDGVFNQAIQLKVTASDSLATASDAFTLLLQGGPVQAPFQFTQNADIYTTSNQGEIVHALGGNDVLTGALGNDNINGNAGNDRIDRGSATTA